LRNKNNFEIINPFFHCYAENFSDDPRTTTQSRSNPVSRGSGFERSRCNTKLISTKPGVQNTTHLKTTAKTLMELHIQQHNRCICKPMLLNQFFKVTQRADTGTHYTVLRLIVTDATESSTPSMD
jgi:hypothetical protein